ncbi:rRNA maturation RNase YbeY [Candidatus Kaiserbacteria bacterium RIFCSPLOWO2_01_FULL_54_24]|uniref:Endoribonuclease YbeY n=1 Tax=Candidatus Kaiserbacteria bacterium RIFCSPLOWO2_01_FULL_54_24 TaxID=1798515 RepID=A0A1F6EW77_9BACT|nr:MAG: rRNA maturation RNase YbeY [Candidatus Kaiserbacteria bacterium RIFCSPLOWO2_01_FULL_54_24]
MRTRSVEVRNTTRTKFPRIPFESIARKILGSHYELSLVICGDARARSLNRKYRKKGYATNVLSFPLTKNDGEIFLNMRAAEREAKKYNVSLRTRLMFLFIHACLHLKGVRHGPKMELLEQKTLKQFI